MFLYFYYKKKEKKKKRIDFIFNFRFINRKNSVIIKEKINKIL